MGEPVQGQARTLAAQADLPVAKFRVPATLPSGGSRLVPQRLDEVLNRDAHACYRASAMRLKRALHPPGPCAGRVADAIRGLAYVQLDLRAVGSKRLADAASGLRQHAGLRGISISSGMSERNLDGRLLAGMLRVHKNTLNELRLNLPLDAARGLADAIASLRALEGFHMDNLSGSPGSAASKAESSVRRLADALGSLQNLRHIDVSDVGAAALLSACLPRLPQLQSLRLRRCSADGEDWGAVADNLQRLQAAQRAPAATETTGLRCLELSRAGLGNGGMVPLMPVLSKLHGLRELVLAGNDIGPAGMASLAGSLRGMAELQVLDLSGNDLHGDAIAHLAGAVADLPHLKALNLLNACLDADDMGRLGAAMKRSQQLQDLVLSFNRLNGCNADDWTALLGPPRLGRLSLGSCSLAPQDVAGLAGALAACPALISLNLTDNDARTAEAARALADGLTRLPRLQALHLPVLGQEGLARLVPALHHLAGGSLKQLFLSSQDKALVAELRPKLPGLDLC